jgi:hypothetical protein
MAADKAVIDINFLKFCIGFPFVLKKGSAMTNAANPLANEVSRAFIPPCTRRDVSPPVAALGPARQNDAGTLAANSGNTKQTACQIAKGGFSSNAN